MPPLDIFTTPIRDKILACESQQETWKLDHKNAKMVFKFEDFLGDMVELYGMLDRVDQVFREGVADDPNSYCEELDQTIRDLHRKFHYAAEAAEVTAISIEAEYHPIDNIADFRECLKNARESANSGYQLDATRKRDLLQSEVSKLLEAE